MLPPRFGFSRTVWISIAARSAAGIDRAVTLVSVALPGGYGAGARSISTINMFTEGAAVCESNGEAVFPWFAVRVKPNFEKAASVSLSGKGLESFLPVYKQTRQWSDRIKSSEVPLFPGYLFCRFNPTRRVPVLSSPGVVGIISFGSDLAPVDEAEIDAVRRVAREGMPAQPWPFLRSGQRVEVRRGPLKGIEGIVLEASTGCSLVLQVSLLQRSLSVKIDRDCIHPVL